MQNGRGIIKKNITHHVYLRDVSKVARLIMILKVRCVVHKLVYLW